MKNFVRAPSEWDTSDKNMMLSGFLIYAKVEHWDHSDILCQCRKFGMEALRYLRGKRIPWCAALVSILSLDSNKANVVCMHKSKIMNYASRAKACQISMT